MRFVNKVKQYWKKQSNQSQQLIKDLPVFKHKTRTPLSIEYKINLCASEITSSQSLIDQITSNMIKKNQTKRKYAGKKDLELMSYNEKVYKYESYSTQEVKLVPSEAERLDVYVDSVFLGKLPKKYTINAVRYLQSTVVMAFAYINGGPYKYYDLETQSIVKKSEPFDISIYIQFS